MVGVMHDLKRDHIIAKILWASLYAHALLYQPYRENRTRESPS